MSFPAISSIDMKESDPSASLTLSATQRIFHSHFSIHLRRFVNRWQIFVAGVSITGETFLELDYSQINLNWENLRRWERTDLVRLLGIGLRSFSSLSDHKNRFGTNLPITRVNLARGVANPALRFASWSMRRRN